MIARWAGVPCADPLGPSGHRAILAVGPRWLRQAVGRIGPTTIQAFVFFFFIQFFL
jgi:hypothetical protein